MGVPVRPSNPLPFWRISRRYLSGDALLGMSNKLPPFCIRYTIKMDLTFFILWTIGFVTTMSFIYRYFDRQSKKNP